MPKQVTVKTRKQVFIVRQRQTIISSLVIKRMGRSVNLLGHKQVLLIEAPVRIPDVQKAWYTDMFPVEKASMVVLTKTSAIREWLVLTLSLINPMNVITTVLCAADGVIMTGQIAGWFIYLNAL